MLFLSFFSLFLLFLLERFWRPIVSNKNKKPAIGLAIAGFLKIFGSFG